MSTRWRRVLVSVAVGLLLAAGPGAAEGPRTGGGRGTPRAKRFSAEALSELWERLRSVWLAVASGQDPAPSGDEGASLDPNGTPSAQGDEGASLDPNG